MARTEARIFTSIWKDPDFTRLPCRAQRLYLFLVSQDDLAYCGVIALRPGRWAAKAEGLTIADIEEDLAILGEGDRPLTITDWESGELLVRALMRRDGIWRQPNLMKSAREAAGQVESPAIRAALAAELRRLPLDETDSKLVLQVVADFLADLEGSGNPSGNPSPNPSGKGSGNPSANPNGNPSRNPSQGRGEGNGSSGEVPPIPVTPSPPRGRAIQRPLLAAVPDVKAGEGEDSKPAKPPGELSTLVAEVRQLRPDWSSTSILRALSDPRTAERGLDRATRAILRMAGDPASKHPGRLPNDGDWWHEPPQQLPASAQEKCPVHHLDEPCRSCAADRLAGAS